ncbi:MAG: guanylate kinase [Dehalococcoidia bacterium]
MDVESKVRGNRRRRKLRQPLLIVLSGPSGVGKDAVLGRMRELGCPFHYVVTATTRLKRGAERNGVDYHFVSQEEFQQMMDENQLLEWSNVYGNYYGVPKGEITSALSQGLDTIVKVDVQGAAAIKEILPQAILIFLMPPSMEDLEERLRRRRSESSEELGLRLRRAKEEIRSLPLFDYVIPSLQDRLDEVVSRIEAIVTAEKCRVHPKVVKL